MLFTFDLVLIDKNFKVVGLKELLRPFRVTRPNFRAESVLELPAHAIIKSRTEIGDQLVIERYEARKSSLDDSAEAEAAVARASPTTSGDSLVAS
jgi:uncharacterized membrane protein (UPF0127 family)